MNQNANNESEVFYPPPPIVEVTGDADFHVVEAKTGANIAVPDYSQVLVENHPTPRAVLGREIFKRLKEGKVSSDRQLARLIALRLQQIPNEAGWILLGFPRSRSQVSPLNALK